MKLWGGGSMSIIVAYFGNLTNVCGGAEKAICDLANDLNRRGYQVDIVSYDVQDGRPFFHLDENIAIYNIKQHISENVSMIKKINREANRLLGDKFLKKWKERNLYPEIERNFLRILDKKRANLIISFDVMTTGCILNAQNDVPVITGLVNDMDFLCKSLTDRERDGLERSKVLQVSSPNFIEDIKRYINNRHVTYIPNAIEQFKNTANLRKNKKKYRIINVARLNREQKRQELLIKAFAKLAGEYPRWHVELWGGDNDGYEAYLRKLCIELEVENRVHFKGITRDLEAIYMEADIFGFPSSHEGFGEALGYAMTAGLPTVAYKSCSAVNEIIEDGVTGFLVEDGISPYVDALAILMKSRRLRIEMGENAHVACQKYAPSQVWDQWEELICQVLNNKELK